MKRKLDLFGALRLPHKFLILGLIGLLLAAVPTARYFRATQEDVDNARAELNGIPSATALLKLIHAVQYHRSLSGMYVSGNDKAGPDMMARENEASQAMAALDQSIPQIGSKAVEDSWSEAKAEWVQIAAAARSRTTDTERNLNAHVALFDKLFRLLPNILDDSHMSLDGDPARHFLVQAALGELPVLSYKFGFVRGYGVTKLSQLANTPLTALEEKTGVRNLSLARADRERLEELAAAAEDQYVRVNRLLDKAFRSSPVARTRLEAGMKEMDDTMKHALEFARHELVQKEYQTVNAAGYFAEMSPAVELQFRYADMAAGFVGEQLSQAVEASRTRQLTTLAQELGLVLLGLAVAFFIVFSITRPLNRLLAAVRRLEDGDEDARARLGRDDEVGRLGMAFDRMMDVRVGNLKRQNEELNNSVLALLQAVAQLARKDLTVKVPVSADVTGAVADALNLLTGETAKVLREVSDISADVTAASLEVKSKSDSVVQAAQQERAQIDQTANSLEATSRTMTQIAGMAQDCNAAAERAITTTRAALVTVTETVGGINGTRDTIRETEKRIKRLGERSQEISVAVNLINSIAERTHILALNAAMHAASAGEAGRGFAVVADEVQRLAENARQATQQIATLVGNIQSETADTVDTMNAAITQVVEGSKLAEQAGRQMEVTQRTTEELVQSVQRIAEQSREQAHNTTELLQRAASIKQSTQETSRQLNEQSQQTNLLVEYARNLLAAVRVFKLTTT
jgi:methyl-accepting chemotaxis protein